MIYSIIGPEWGKVEQVLDDGSGPMVYSRDYGEVEARTRREARTFAPRILRAIPGGFLSNYPDENPFAGLVIHPKG